MTTTPETRSAVPAAGADPLAAAQQRAWYQRAALFIGAGLLLLGAHVFVPLEEFVHRGDDAFYYFKVALNYPQYGFWTFDGINATNGVQPLWAIILTAVAVVFSWFGVTDAYVMARVFVAVTALTHFAAAVVLFRLLARQVSVGTGLIAAGAFLFPMSLVWGRVWGMESGLYALMLAVTVSFYLSHVRERATTAAALALGLLLGATALSRLNGGFLIPCLLGFHLLGGGRAQLLQRFRTVLLAGLAATAVLLPFFIYNQLATGHFLPISGSVKGALMQLAMENADITSRFSIDYLRLIYWEWHHAPARYLAERTLEGLWPLGARLLLLDGGTLLHAAAFVLVLLLAPAAVATPREWRRFLRARLARLAPLGFFAAFAVLDSAVSVWLYPTQTYAIVRWWMVPNEILLITLVATFAAASISFLAERLVPARRRLALATVALAALVLLHAGAMVRMYWDGEMDYMSWSLSWNDEMYHAAQWINGNVPEGERVGSWNAGVVGYYSTRPVVNLDGLINNFELLPYIRERRVADYIRDRNIRYLSDVDRYMVRAGVIDELRLTEVYRRRSEFLRRDYRIYRVED
jgi:hypothetical protein